MPGGNATFVFWYSVTADHACGTFREYFRPVADGVTWMEDYGVYWDVNVVGCLTADADRFVWPTDPNFAGPGFYAACGDWPGISDGCYWLGAGGWRDANPFQRHYNSGFGYHLGADWNLGSGSDDADRPVYTAASGTVVSVQANVTGWGNIIFVRHDTSFGVFTSMYAHVNWNTSGPPNLGPVARGAQIARVGNGNGAWPYHLHFEVRQGLNMSPGAGYTGAQVTVGPQGQIDPNAFVASHR